jgi:thymidylate synthase ThyX
MPENRQEGSSRFTPQERALLARYVTNTDGSVFALTNLPEVIKGALFSRYSRSALGLRELLLKEFISDPAAEFAAIGGAAPGADPEAAAHQAHLAVARAQDFYSRILDGYGDDSIGELGGAHLAIENVSMIATKALEDARIGGSPLEKSTRYVYFGEKQGGDFLFYKEPTLLASRHGERYLATCRLLFGTYRDLVEPLTAHVERAWPRPPEASAGAWRRSVRARVYDGLRGLLPAATLTNMGIFGNGRFFESLLMRLQVAPLEELRGLGRAMYAELAQLIPSFVRRANPEHPHFAQFHAYDAALSEWLARSGLAAMPDAGSAPVAAAARGEVAELLDWDPDAPAKVLAALAYPRAAADLRALRAAAARLPAGEQAARLAALAALRGNRRHKPPRALELASYTFDLLGDFGMYRDLHRHRMLTQQRQPLSTRHGYDVPEDVAAAGLQAPFAAAMERAAEAYQAIAADLPAEAQYVVPMAYRIRWHLHVNLRALIWLVELRSTPQGHPAYRRMAQALYRRVAEVHPAFAPLFKFVDLADYPLGRIEAEQRQEQRREEGGSGRGETQGDASGSGPSGGRQGAAGRRRSG